MIISFPLSTHGNKNALFLNTLAMRNRNFITSLDYFSAVLMGISTT